jgi:hypothetical protein
LTSEQQAAIAMTGDFVHPGKEPLGGACAVTQEASESALHSN